MRIFELLGFADDPHLDRSVVAPYEAALATYRQGDFSVAKSMFLSIPGDSPAKMMASRCDALLRGETILENGAYAMHTK